MKKIVFSILALLFIAAAGSVAYKLYNYSNDKLDENISNENPEESVEEIITVNKLPLYMYSFDLNVPSFYSDGFCDGVLKIITCINVELEGNDYEKFISLISNISNITNSTDNQLLICTFDGIVASCEFPGDDYVEEGSELKYFDNPYVYIKLCNFETSDDYAVLEFLTKDSETSGCDGFEFYNYENRSNGQLDETMISFKSKTDFKYGTTIEYIEK